MKKLILVITIIASFAMFTGCSNIQTDVKYSTMTEQSRTASILEQDREDYLGIILELITTGGSSNTDLKILSTDIVSDADIKQIYWSNGSIYIQINNKYMYRFQLNSSNKIESYIKYELEG